MVSASLFSAKMILIKRVSGAMEWLQGSSQSTQRTIVTEQSHEDIWTCYSVALLGFASRNWAVTSSTPCAVELVMEGSILRFVGLSLQQLRGDCLMVELDL